MNNAATKFCILLFVSKLYFISIVYYLVCPCCFYLCSMPTSQKNTFILFVFLSFFFFFIKNWPVSMRISYRDWSSNRTVSWKAPIQERSLNPVVSELKDGVRKQRWNMRECFPQTVQLKSWKNNYRFIKWARNHYWCCHDNTNDLGFFIILKDGSTTVSCQLFVKVVKHNLMSSFSCGWFDCILFYNWPL